MTEKIFEGVYSYNKEGFYKFGKVLRLDIHLVDYIPLRGSSYIPLPKYLADKKAIISIENKDNQCFKWCIARALNPINRDAEHFTKILRGQAKELNCDSVTFPMPCTDAAIGRFEKQNPTVSIHVFGAEARGNHHIVYPLRISERYERKHEIDLLLIHDGKKQHYCLIKSLSRSVCSQISKHDGNKFICRRCLSPFNTKERLDEHLESCSAHDVVKVVMPKEGSTLKFKNFFKQMRVPFIVEADFESFTEKMKDTSRPDPKKKSYTKRYQKHTPSGFCYHIKCFDKSVYKQEPVIYTKQPEDEDVAQTFVEMLERDLKGIYATCGKAEMT